MVRNKYDISMKGFAKRTSVKKMLSLIKENCSVNKLEKVEASKSAGLILAEDLISAVDLPGFQRSAMDGYALKGEETFGADGYNPLSFEILGLVTPGSEFKGTVNEGQAVKIMTGAPLPPGANAVMMAEYTEEKDNRVEVMKATPPGKNVSAIGEDIKKGEAILKKYRKMRPQDAAIAVSVGIREALMFKRPEVDLIITGNELLKPGEKPSGVKIVDSNSVLLSSLIKRDGGVVKSVQYIRDDRELIKKALTDSEADIICVSGGASVGVEDYAASLVDELGRVLAHGVAMRPASPTGFGLIGEKKVFMLPGNPVSSMAAYDFFVRTALLRLGNHPLTWPYPRKKIKLATKISSQPGRVDYVRVLIEDGQARLLAGSGASILSSTTRADGFLITREESEGFAEGEVVDIWLYDEPASFDQMYSCL